MENEMAKKTLRFSCLYHVLYEQVLLQLQHALQLFEVTGIVIEVTGPLIALTIFPEYGLWSTAGKSERA